MNFSERKNTALSILIWAVVLMTTAGVVSAIAQDQGPSVIIVNNDHDGDPITGVFIWHDESDSMGPNRLAVVLINRDPPWLFVDESVEITLHGGGMRDRCEFYMHIVDEDGDQREGRVNLCEIDHVYFN